MKVLNTLIIFLFLASNLSVSDELDNKVLAEIGDDKITYERLDQAFQKNMPDKKKRLYDLSKDSLMDFLNLFINYRLKVKDAIDKGFHEDPEVKAEVEQNKKMLTESFYYDKKVLEPHVEKYLNRRHYYLKFAYIILTFPQGELTPEQMQPKEKAQSILDSLKAGQLTFEEAAKTHSADKKTGQNGGVVESYVLSGNIQRPIEDALFTLEEGEHTKELVKTSYGYFIIKLVEKKPRKLVLPAHILIEKKGEEITEEMEKKADSLLTAIKNGADFSTVAELESEDPASAIKGGKLDSYYDLAKGFEKSGDRLDQKFAETLFSLEDGEISDTIHTSYGIHIIKRIDSKEPDWEAEEEEITKFYKRTHYENDKKAHIADKVKELGFELNEDLLDEFTKFVNTNKTNLDTAWAVDIPKTIYDETLFSYKNEQWTVNDFIKLLSDRSNTELRATALDKDGLKEAMHKIIDPLLLEDLAAELEREYPEFKRLVKEFYDGILLFKVEALEVWDKLKLDTALAKTYFDTTSREFFTEKQYDISEIFVLSDSVADEIKTKLENGESFEKLAEQHTHRQGFREKKGHHGKLKVGDNRFSSILEDKKIEEGAIIGPEKYQRGISILKINEIVEPRKKNFEEAMTDLAPIVQEIKQKNLTEKWLSRIKEKHEIKINKENINEIYEEYNN